MEKTIKRIKKNIKKTLIFLAVAFFAFAPNLYAADLSLIPATGTHNIGETFTVGVYVSSPDQSMNAVSASINFPTDKLQVVSVSKSQSIIDFWAKEPSFSNSTGRITLDGVILSPGFQGNSGRILNITFKGKASGITNISISGSSVLANDGIGTTILRNVGSAKFTIVEIPDKEPETIDLDKLKPIEGIPIETNTCTPDSLITSTTHPGIIWRRENNASFSWDIGDDVLASKIAFDQNPDTEPNIINSPALVEKQYENVADGIWYFHLSLQNNSGWTKTENFEIKVDSTPPVIEAKEIPRTDLSDPRPIIALSLSDKISCVRDFDLSIDGEPISYTKISDGKIMLDAIPPGTHELAITAYDRASNENQTFLDITVQAIKEPEITSYPNEIKVGETLTIEGQAIPNGNISAKITNKKNSLLLKQDFQSGSGKWTLHQDGLKEGTVFVSFQVTDTRGAKSNWSEPIAVNIVGNSFLPNIGSFGLKIIIVGIIFGILIIIIITRALTIRKMRRDME